MRIDVADGPDSPDLVIRDGLVRISRTDRPAYLEAGEVTDDGEATDEGLEVIGGDDVAPDVNVMDETALHPGPVPLPEPEPAAGARAGGRRRDAAHRRPADEPAGACGRWPRRADPGRQLGARRARPQPARHPGAAAGTAACSRSRSPGSPSPAARSSTVDRAVIVGRAPEARRFTSTEQPRLVTVPSPNQEISSTHLEIRPGAGADHGSAVATDLGSTNGTVLQQPGLPSEDLKPGIAVQLIPGAIIDLGDGVTIQVGQA